MPWEKACDADIKTLCKDVKDDVRPCLAQACDELRRDPRAGYATVAAVRDAVASRAA